MPPAFGLRGLGEGSDRQTSGVAMDTQGVWPLVFCVHGGQRGAEVAICSCLCRLEDKERRVALLP
jgi:hypothetical protein